MNTKATTPAPDAPVAIEPTVAAPPDALMAAVEASLVEPVAGAPTPTPGPDVTADPPSHGQDPSDQPPKSEPGDGAPASTTPAGEGEVKPDSEPAVPDAEKPKEGEAAKEGEQPAAAKKPSDEFGELPKDVKQETRERFESIKGKYDTVVAERDRAVSVATRWHETIQSTGATPEQFNKVLVALRDANSGTPEGIARYFDALMSEITPLAKLLGRPIGGVVNPLDDYPDLKSRVEDEDDGLTEADALEIARARATGKLHEAATTRTEAVSQQEAAENAGLEQVRQLGLVLQGRDIADPAQKAAAKAAFDAKYPFIKPMIDTVIATMPPAQWVPAIRKAYAEMPMPAAPAAPVTLAKVPNPVRPGPGGGVGAVKEPGSALEAIDLALGLG